jgi:hypothetical protein
MGLKKMVLAGAALATMTVGFAAPAFAATQSAAQPARTMTAFQPMGDEHGDADVSGLASDSPVCSALGAETIPTGHDLAKCLVGTTLV